MEMLSFFFDQFKIPIIGFLVLGTFFFVRVYLIPVRAEIVNDPAADSDEIKNQSTTD